MRDPNHTPHPFRLGVEVRVPQEAANKRGNLILPDTCHYYAVTGVPQTRRIEARISREECRVAVLAQ
jgi:hypothetical protein